MIPELLTYPKSGPMAGRLIRKMISLLRENDCSLPIDSHILIAVSGGVDSVALAHLLAHGGRRIIDRSRMTLLHINHHWRDEDSDENERFVRSLAQSWGLPLVVRHLKPPHRGSGESWEEKARHERKQIFREEMQKSQARWVMTAHHGDDLAETLVWRLFTGTSRTHGGGIALECDSELRPLLRVRKKELEAYLQEVGQKFYFDSTNDSDRFLRSRMRKVLMPEVEKLFPRAVENLIAVGLQAQENNSNFHGDAQHSQVELKDESSSFNPQILFQAAGIRARKRHFEALLEKVQKQKNWRGEVHLPQGWVLTREFNRQKSTRGQKTDTDSGKVERWVLEKRELQADS